MKHSFTIGSLPAVNLDAQQMMAIFSIMHIQQDKAPHCVNARVRAIKWLRQETGLGLLEAKLTIDYVHEHGFMDEAGNVQMHQPRPAIAYAMVG